MRTQLTNFEGSETPVRHYIIHELSLLFSNLKTTKMKICENTMEIDFLIRKAVVTNRHNICPIEVKSTQRYTTSSLDKFRKRYSSFLGTSYILHSGDYKRDGNNVYLPLYMTGLL